MELGLKNHNGDGLLGPKSIMVVYMDPLGKESQALLNPAKLETLPTTSGAPRAVVARTPVLCAMAGEHLVRFTRPLQGDVAAPRFTV